MIEPSQAPHTPHHPSGGHETKDASVRSLIIFAVSMAGTIFLVCVGMVGVFRYFGHHQTLGPPASPFEQGRPLPGPGLPRLQVAPRQDLEQVLQQQNEILNSYAWVDQKSGIVRIPVERAMDLLIQRGFPVRAAGEQKTNEGAKKNSPRNPAGTRGTGG
jgi:hypothetical protein